MGQNKPNVPETQMNMLSDYYQKTQGSPSPIENEFGPTRQNLANQFTNAIQRQTGNYDDIMGTYGKIAGSVNPNASRPDQVQQGYDTLTAAGKTFGDMAATGGYSPQDIQDLRARGMSPITASYANAMQQMDRARALGGGGANAPNYIAAVSRAQRTMPQQLSDAMQGVNAGIAQNVVQNKLAGAQGEAGVGSSIAGAAASEAQRQDAARQAAIAEQLGAAGGQASLYGTTPGQASMFGNQVLGAYGLSGTLDTSRNQLGLTALGDYVNAFTGAPRQIPAWQTALGIAGDVAPFALAPFTGGASLGMGGI